MKKILILVYMFFAHPVIFWKYTIRHNSKYFLVNGHNQNIKIKGLRVEKNVRIGNYTRINFYDKGKLYFGEGCYMGQRNSFLVGADIHIGAGVLMASDICIASENHGMNPESQVGYGGQSLVTSPVIIDKGCWIGEKVMILPGVHIGEKTIIGAGSVVTKNIPEYCIAVGNPAMVIKKYDFRHKKWMSLQTNSLV